MPRISEAAYRAAKAIVAIYENDRIPWWFREAIHSETGTEDLPGRNKPLAPRKPAGSRAKGKPAKTRKQARKVSGKK